MNRMQGRAWVVVLALSPLPVLGAGDNENLEFPPLVPDEVITGEVAVAGAGAPAAQAAPAVAPAPSQSATTQVTAAPQYAPAPQYGGSGYQAVYPGYGYPGYQGQGYYPGYYSGWPGYGAYSGYGYPQPGYYPGYGAPSPGYYGYRRPVRKSNNWPFDFDWPWIGGTWTEGPWNNGKFSRGDWLGGGPGSWFRGGDFKEGMAEMWDDMVNAPAEMGTMPGGWEFPTVSTPNPVDVGDELGRAAPEFVREVPNMIDINP